MMSRAEIAIGYGRAFRAADKRTKGRILDEVVSVTGWSRDSARRRQRVWAASGGQCGSAWPRRCTRAAGRPGTAR
ncbi:MAG TPA: hypothetical protein VIU11_16415 [Nakamurella sp.]